MTGLCFRTQLHAAEQGYLHSPVKLEVQAGCWRPVADLLLAARPRPHASTSVPLSLFSLTSYTCAVRGTTVSWWGKMLY
jgi:hypothetical protein